MATSSNSDRKEEEYLQCAWKCLQHEEVTELEHAAVEAKKGQRDEHQLTQLVHKIVQHFQEHSANRIRQARKDVSPFFAPVSGTTLENSVLWIGGCRPSSFIRFIYALSGLETEAHITQLFDGMESSGEFPQLTGEQLNMIDELQAKTIKQEKKLSSRLASLQEDIVDQPLTGKMKKEGHDCDDANEALDEHSRHMASVLEEADELRMKTLKEIVLTILEPVQAVEYLAASKKIRFCVQQWGEKRDHEHSD